MVPTHHFEQRSISRLHGQQEMLYMDNQASSRCRPMTVPCNKLYEDGNESKVDGPNASDTGVLTLNRRDDFWSQTNPRLVLVEVVPCFRL